MFVLSSDHSGSTWVGYVLGSHPDSAFLGEFFRGWDPELRQPCTTCLAEGLAECSVLHGFEQVKAADAFSWAFARTDRQVLVDSSKVLSWPGRSLENAPEVDVRLVHVVRDPCGWLNSHRRRKQALSCPDMMRAWVRRNVEIHAFATESGHPYTTVFYDELAQRPEAGFKALARFCGLAPSRDALKYWNVRHHGFAANGATRLALPRDTQTAGLPHLVTADEWFYARNRDRMFSDLRWRDELPEAEAQLIAADPDVNSYLRSTGRELTDTGLRRLPFARVRAYARQLFGWPARLGYEPR